MSQRFTLDGNPVAYVEGAFAQHFDMEPSEAESVSYDDMVVLVVVARAGVPQFKESKSGDLIRRNRFEVTAAKVADAKLGEELAEMFGLDVQQKLPFASPTTPPPPPPPSAPVPPTAPATAQKVPVSVGVPSGSPVGTTASLHNEDEALRKFLEDV